MDSLGMGFRLYSCLILRFTRGGSYIRMAKKALSDCSEAPIMNYKGAGLLLLIRVCRTSRLRIGIESAKEYKQQSARGDYRSSCSITPPQNEDGDQQEKKRPRLNRVKKKRKISHRNNSPLIATSHLS
jgi:hypothetical protein